MRCAAAPGRPAAPSVARGGGGRSPWGRPPARRAPPGVARFKPSSGGAEAEPAAAAKKAPAGHDGAGAHRRPGGGAKLQAQLDDMASQYRALDKRLDSLEGTLVTLLHNVKARSARPAAAAGVGPAGEAQDDTAALAEADAEDVPDYEGYDGAGRRAGGGGRSAAAVGGGSSSVSGGGRSAAPRRAASAPRCDGAAPRWRRAAEDESDEGGGLFDLKRLQSSLTENLNRGYLEARARPSHAPPPPRPLQSVKHLRDMLLAHEWHLHGKELAERRRGARRGGATPRGCAPCGDARPSPRRPARRGRRGVAVFEQHCVEHDLEVEYDTITQLYDDPNDLGVLRDDKLRRLARALIQQAVDERYCSRRRSIYAECTATAKELAHTGLKDLIPDSAGKARGGGGGGGGCGGARVPGSQARARRSGGAAAAALGRPAAPDARPAAAAAVGRSGA
ncbi:hypothetical protein HT031_006554 [Scenedesmus sp. PABB004]|nr:hypothetical protein HT031_006554 [Scenedesmus sp. PABB004]